MGSVGDQDRRYTGMVGSIGGAIPPFSRLKNCVSFLLASLKLLDSRTRCPSLLAGFHVLSESECFTATVVRFLTGAGDNMGPLWPTRSGAQRNGPAAGRSSKGCNHVGAHLRRTREHSCLVEQKHSISSRIPEVESLMVEYKQVPMASNMGKLDTLGGNHHASSHGNGCRRPKTSRR